MKTYERIYLDYAATSPTRVEVIKAMEPFYRRIFGNPSSIHSFGREAREAVDEAREKVALILDCVVDEIYFTSGGTESDNLAIRGLIQATKDKVKKPHIITSSVEHQAVYNTCKELEAAGEACVTYLPVSKDGVISLDSVKKAIRPETVLVTIIYVSNEIGTVQPIREIGRYLDIVNQERENRIYLHTDAVQAAEYCILNIKYLHVDMLSLSGHKFGAPKGIGVLYANNKVPLRSIMSGGLQESALRPGTENIQGIVGLANGLELAISMQKKGEVERIVSLKNKLEIGLKAIVPELHIIGESVERSPAITAMIFPNIDGPTMLMNLDLKGIVASSGSACSAGSTEDSHILQALCLKDPYTGGAVRFSLGPDTSEEQIDETLLRIKEIVESLRI